MRRWLGIGLGLLGCTRAATAPPFPFVWEAKGVHELSARTRRVERVTHHTATWELVIDCADIELGGKRGPAPVRVEVAPSGVKPGLILRALRVEDLQPVTPFLISVELAASDAAGDEQARLGLVVEASGSPRVLELRPFGK